MMNLGVRLRLWPTLVGALLAAGWCVSLAGCPAKPAAVPVAKKAPAPPKMPAVVQQSAVSPPADASVGDGSTSPPTDAATDAKSPAESPASPEAVEASATSASPASEASATAVAAEPAYGTERIMIFAPDGPVIVELRMSIDGQPHDSALDELVAEVLKLADTDGDGRPTWQEVVESKRFKYGQLGNVAIEGEYGGKQVLEMYDQNRDGTVDAPELPRFLTRNAGSARSFSVRGTADHRVSAGRESPLWQLLDRESDGTLTDEELATAEFRLWSRDSDDDEILAAAELAAPPSMMPGMAAPRRRRGPDAVKLLGPHADWDSVRFELERAYAGARSLKPDSFPRHPKLFASLDENGDGRLAKAEFPKLDTLPPHVVLAVHFGRRREVGVTEVGEGEDRKSEDGKSEAGESEVSKSEVSNSEDNATENASASAEPPVRTPTIRLVSVDPSLTDGEAAVDEIAGRVTVPIGGTTLTVYLNDMALGGGEAARAEQLLMQFDADKNGYLEMSEVPETAVQQLGAFEAVDADDDGKIYPAEIREYLAGQQAAQRSQIHAKVEDREDRLFAMLDANRDERLDRREVAEAAERLQALATRRPGQITAGDLPEVLMLGLARGNAQNLDALFTPPPARVQTVAADLPRWFRSMDANADGAISRREFIGPLTKFDELDANGDGLLEAAEAVGSKRGNGDKGQDESEQEDD
jgi:Ca2+-binding EF-hand superfamily protein